MNINLTKNEYNYLLNDSLISNQYKNSFFKSNNTYHIEITQDDADNLRDALLDKIEIQGFDLNYNLNLEGEILQSLIDKLYT